MENKEKETVQLPDNAFRELHEGESYSCVLRLQVPDLMPGRFNVTLLFYSENDFKIDICGFYDYPSDHEVMYGHEYCVHAKATTLDRINNLVYYRYTFSALKDINYLSLSLTRLKSDIYPNSLFIYSESGTQEAPADPN